MDQEMQYLIECSNKSLSIVYERSIVKDKKVKSLKIGDVVKFHWPEDKKPSRLFSGTIIQNSYNELVLLKKMQEMCKAITRTSKAKSDKPTKTSASEGGTKKSNTEKHLVKIDSNQNALRKRAAGLVSRQILVEMQNQIVPVTASVTSKSETRTNKEPKEKSSNHEWFVDQLKTVSTYMDACLTAVANVQENIQIMNTMIQYLMESSTQQTNQIDADSKEPGSQSNKETMPEIGFLPSPKECVLNRSYNMPEQVDEDFEEFDLPEFDVNEAYCSQDKITSNLIIENNENVQPSTSGNNKQSLTTYASPSSSTSSGVRVSRKRSILILSSDDEDVPSNETHAKLRKGEDFEFNFDLKKVKKEKIESEKTELSDDSGKWTLQHQIGDKNVTELMKGSNIFVDAFSLKNTTNNCRRQTVLARALLDLVFTEEALARCSIKGKKASGKGASSDIRPGLNINGVNAILVFSRKFAKDNGWEVRENQSVLSSMRQKMVELKDKKELNNKRNQI